MKAWGPCSPHLFWRVWVCQLTVAPYWFYEPIKVPADWLL